MILLMSRRENKMKFEKYLEFLTCLRHQIRTLEGNENNHGEVSKTFQTSYTPEVSETC